MRPRATVALLVFALVAVALSLALRGAPHPPASPPGAGAFVDPLEGHDEGHDHANPRHHAPRAWGMRVVAHADLTDDGGERAAIGEMDVCGDRVFVATNLPEGGVTIVDLADPAAPRVVGRYQTGTGYVADVKVTPDCRTALVATEPDAAFAALLGGARVAAESALRYPTAGTPLAGDFGVHVVDVRDPSRPLLRSLLPTGEMGIHMLALHEIGGALHAFLADFASVTDPKVVLARLDAGDPPLLRPVGAYRAPQQGAGTSIWARGADDAVAPHDVAVWDDPVLGRPMMFVANKDGGVRMVDVSDPASPVEVAAWTGWAPETGGAIHSVAPALLDGRRIVFASQEVGSGPDTGTWWAVDFSQTAAPRTLAAWNAPGTHPSVGSSLYSTHNLHFADGRLLLAHYHAGVWVFDVRDPANPVPTAYYVPGGAQRPAPLWSIAWTPFVWEALPFRDFVLATDTTGGLYVLKVEE